MRQKLISYILMAALITVLFAGVPLIAYGEAGDGTFNESVFTGVEVSDEKSVYLISTPAALDEIRDGLDKDYKLIDDIDMSGMTFRPIGAYNNKFTGTFDGNGKKISNLTIVNSDEYTALFSAASGVVIKDLTLDNINISGYGFTAGLIGYLGDITVNGTSEISNCCVTGESSIYCRGTNPKGMYNGGLIGKIENSSLYNIKITNCTSSASVVIPEEIVSTRTGGLVGYAYKTQFDNCHVTGNLLIDGTNCFYLGGFAGFIKGCSISNCSVSGNITATDKSHYISEIGGFVGYVNNRLDSSRYTSSDLRNCSFSGNIRIFDGTRNIGGFAGYVEDREYGYTKFDKCHSICKLEVGNAVYTNTTSNVGGFIGQHTNGEISQCYTIADITLYSNSSSKNSSNASYIGGFAGYILLSEEPISNCYARGSITKSSDGDFYYAGGFAGRINDYKSVNLCYTTVRPMPEGKALYGMENAYVQQFAPIQPGLTSCFYDLGEEGEALPGENAFGKSTSDMKIADTFTGYDFAEIWAIDPAINSGYPYLRNNPPPGVENEASTNSKLLSISLSIGNLNEEFSSDIYRYTATVPNNIAAITIDAEPEDSKASVVLSKNQTVVSNPVSLDVGENTFAVTVTAENANYTSTYNIIITREDTLPVIPSSDCEVVSVAQPSGTIISSTEITANVPNSKTSQAVDVTVSSKASWKLYSNTACTDELVNKIMGLNVGENSAYIKVTAEDDSTTKIYTITITRESADEPEEEEPDDSGNGNENIPEETPVVLSSDCKVVDVISPQGAVISDTKITASVPNSSTSQVVDVTVSPKASWKLYSDIACTKEIADKTANLDVGINTVYIKVKAEDGTSKIYTLYITREDEDEDGSGTGEETPLPTINIDGQDINYIRDEQGSYIFKPTKDQFGMLHKQRKDGMYCIDLIGLPADAEGVTFVTDSAWFDRIGHSLLFNAPGIGSIEINDAMFGIIKSGKIISFVLRKGSLQADVLIDGESIDWSSYLNPVKITIPYILKAEENVDYIVAYRLGKDGWKNILPDSKYNAKNQEISFTSQMFGHFNVMYNPKAFDDVKQGQWYEKAIGYMSARGIINGVGNNNFEPNTNIKRADFLLMLMRMYGIDADEKAGDNFDDAGSTYYTDMLGTAKRLGIVKGLGGNKFAPEATILRQDMLVMLYRVMNTLGRLPKVPEGGKTVENFSDAGEISDYAYQTLRLFVQSGLIKGDGNMLTPKDTAIRAEAAQILFNILNE